MAAPKYHAVPTLGIGAVSLFLNPLAIPRTIPDFHNWLILGTVFAFGIFLDGDHLSIRRIQKIRRGEKGPVEGWVNWMHTWWAMVAVAAISFLIGSWLPLLSYAVHMLMDGGDRDNSIHPGSAPLPSFIHRFYPERWKYETGLII